jgi:hypothetical protein
VLRLFFRKQAFLAACLSVLILANAQLPSVAGYPTNQTVINNSVSTSASSAPDQTAGKASSPTPAPTWPPLHSPPNSSVIATMGLSDDSQTNARLAVELAGDLRRWGVVNNSFILPTTFNLDNLNTECHTDPAFKAHTLFCRRRS